MLWLWHPEALRRLSKSFINDQPIPYYLPTNWQSKNIQGMKPSKTMIFLWFFNCLAGLGIL